MNKIDKIFQDKFKDFEKSPSSRAWDKLSEGLDEKEKNKKGFFWYSVAAVVTLVLLASLFITDSNQEEKTLADRIKPVDTVTKKPLANTNTFTSSLPSDIEKIVYSKQKPLTKKQKLTQGEEQKEPREEVILTLQESKKIDYIEEEIIEVEDSEEADIPAENQNIDNSLPSEAISVVIKRGNSSIATPKEESEKNSLKRSKIARMYTQVLNIKNGEKVDLDEFSDLLAFHKKGKTTQNK